MALVLAAAILVRLALNPYVLSYDTTHALGSHWVLYGYGIPAAASCRSAACSGRRADDYR